MDALQIHAVYINETIFSSLLKYNSNLIRYDVFGWDNRPSNKGLPAVYNEVIEQSLDEDVWLFLVHEDFEIKCDLDHLQDLSPDTVYGSFGVKMHGDYPVGYGAHQCSRKDGSGELIVGVKVTEPLLVDTLDCQSVLINTRLLRAHPELRFDEKLTFDLYVEDFCINATHRHGIPVKAIPLEFQHYSYGKVTERYYRGLEYLASKYPDVGVPGSCSFIGGQAKELEKKFQYNIKAME